MSYSHKKALEIFSNFLHKHAKEITAPIISAGEFAVEAHQGQLRKTEDTPYVIHVFDVASILIKAQAPENVIIAGILHDIIEDTSKNEEDIETLFSKSKAQAILKIIMADNETDKTASWEERKQETIDYMNSSRSKNGMLLICADKISNLKSISEAYSLQGDEIWKCFKRGKEKQIWYYQEISNCLHKKLKSYPSLLKEYDSLLKTIL